MNEIVLIAAHVSTDWSRCPNLRLSGADIKPLPANNSDQAKNRGAERAPPTSPIEFQELNALTSAGAWLRTNSTAAPKCPPTTGTPKTEAQATTTNRITLRGINVVSGISDVHNLRHTRYYSCLTEVYICKYMFCQVGAWVSNAKKGSLTMAI